MTTALHHWINLLVKITLRSEVPAVMEGTLFQIDDTGIVLEKSTGKIFIPLAAILHIKLCEETEA